MFYSIFSNETGSIYMRYEIKNPEFHLPNIRHSFGEQAIGYCLIKQLMHRRDPP